MRLRSVSLALLVAVTALAGTASTPPITSVVRVLAINDFHGNLSTPAPLAGRTVGGADYLSAELARLRVGHPLNITVGAGDLIGASPLMSGLFHDEGTIEALNRMGLRVSSVGNHEFDDGRLELLRMQHGGCAGGDSTMTCRGGDAEKGGFEGARFRYLAANVVDSVTGEPIFPPYSIETFQDGGHALRIGFIGLTLAETATIVSPSGVAGLRFEDEAKTVNALVPKLRAQGVEAIVGPIHQGAGTAPRDINECAADGKGLDPIRGIVAQLDDAVDLVVSGHTHLEYVCRMANRAGRKIPVTQAGSFGRVVTSIDLTLDQATGDVIAADPVNHWVDRSDPTIAADPVVAGIVQHYRSLVAAVSDRLVGAVTGDVPTGGDEMPMGELIADAQLASTRAPFPAAARLAFMNRGGVRGPLTFGQISGGEQPGEITYAEAFAIQPFGNHVITMTLTARDLKDLLEQEFAGCAPAGEPAQTLDRLIQVSDGFTFSWDPSVPANACDRVKRITLDGARIWDEADGGFVAPSSASTTFRVTVNSFIADGGDGYTVLRRGTERVDSGADVEALVTYLQRFLPPHAPYDAAAGPAGRPRVTRIGATSSR